MANKPKVIVIGLDGGTWDLLRPLMEKGVMPNLTRLVENGAAGVLHSSLPNWTPTAWSSFATGKNPGRHGVFGFSSRNADGSKTWVSSRSIRTPTLWRILSDNGRSVGLINIPLTYPPENLNGYVVSGFPAPDSAKDMTFPPQLLGEMESSLGHYILDCKVDDVNWERNKTEEGMLGRLGEFKAMTESRGRALSWLMDRYPTDFLMVVFVAPDRIQHAFWKWLDPSCPHYSRPEASRYRDKATEVYALIDGQVGRLLDGLDRGTHIFLVSDHGFGALNKLFLTNKWLSQAGFLRYSGVKKLLWAACDKGRIFRSSALLKLLPALSRLRADTCINWEATLAYGGQADESGIFIRAKNGHPKNVAQSIKDKLLATKDPETGRPIAEAVLLRDEVYSGPFVDRGPDLLVRWGPGYCGVGFDSIGQRDWLTRVLDASGDHAERGIFAALGGAIKPGAEPDASIVDVAPTILHLMGLAVPGDMDGRVLTEIFSQDFIEQNPVTYAGAADEQYGLAGHQEVYSPEDVEEIRKRLEALGYLD